VVDEANRLLCYVFQTRVLVTHSVAFLTQLDKIYVLVDGRVSEVKLFFEISPPQFSILKV